jgi:hypothetical protein
MHLRFKEVIAMRIQFRSLVLFIVLAVLGIGITAGCAIARPRRAHAARRAELAQHRSQQITRLHAYAEAGVFPQNPRRTLVPVHMFKDMFGTRCAVANLIYLDGHGDLVDKMAAERNDVVVADETSGPLHDWVLGSGLTNEEVRRIQGVGFEFALDDARAIAERDRLQKALREVEKELIAASDESLEVATNRLEQSSAPSAAVALR